ncbi:MAG: hypothetical protein ACOZBZ_02735 [Patescibacteria group bacterium]
MTKAIAEGEPRLISPEGKKLYTRKEFLVAAALILGGTVTALSPVGRAFLKNLASAPSSEAKTAPEWIATQERVIKDLHKTAELEVAPFGTVDLTSPPSGQFHSSVLEEIEKCPTYKIGNREIVAAPWWGALVKTKEKNVYALTSFSTIPDRLNPETRKLFFGWRFDENGDLVITSEDIDTLQTWHSEDGFNWVRVK